MQLFRQQKVLVGTRMLIGGERTSSMRTYSLGVGLTGEQSAGVDGGAEFDNSVSKSAPASQAQPELIHVSSTASDELRSPLPRTNFPAAAALPPSPVSKEPRGVTACV
jgi:hypothetical protein